MKYYYGVGLTRELKINKSLTLSISRDKVKIYYGDIPLGNNFDYKDIALFDLDGFKKEYFTFEINKEEFQFVLRESYNSSTVLAWILEKHPELLL